MCSHTNLFFNMVIQCWHARCQQLELNYCISVVGNLSTRELDYSCHPRLLFYFADDAAIVAPTKDSIVKATVELDKVVRACGLKIGNPKTKFLVAGKNVTQSDLDPNHVGDGIIESVASFRYLVSVVECHGGVAC